MPRAVTDREQDAQSHSGLPRRHCEAVDPSYHDLRAGRSLSVRGTLGATFPVALLPSVH